MTVTESIFRRVIVPVANEEDATATVEAVAPYVDAPGVTVTVVHVIEKAGGAPDKASVEQREQYAREVFAAITDGLDGVAASLETELLYGTDVAATIIDAAHDKDATAIVFTPRGGSRWRQLLTGDVAHKLVETSDVPVVVLPDREASDA